MVSQLPNGWFFLMRGRRYSYNIVHATKQHKNFNIFLWVWLLLSSVSNIAGISSLVDSWVGWKGVFLHFIELYDITIREPIRIVAALFLPRTWLPLPDWSVNLAVVWMSFSLSMHAPYLLSKEKSFVRFYCLRLVPAKLNDSTEFTSASPTIRYITVLMLSPVIAIFLVGDLIWMPVALPVYSFIHYVRNRDEGSLLVLRFYASVLGAITLILIIMMSINYQLSIQVQS
jgi:hypothetical protein